MDQDKELKNKVDNFSHRLKERALGINEMKPEVKKRFLEISKNDYGNHHGVTVEWLVKLYDNYFPKGNEEVNIKIDLIADEVKKLRKDFDVHIDSQSENPDTPEGYVRSADGSKLIRKS